MSKEFRATRNDKAILAALAKAGTAGMTADAIFEATSLRPADIKSRLKVLVSEGLVSESDAKQITDGGRAKIYRHAASLVLAS